MQSAAGEGEAKVRACLDVAVFGLDHAAGDGAVGVVRSDRVRVRGVKGAFADGEEGSAVEALRT